MIFQSLTDQLLQLRIKILGIFQGICKFTQFLGHYGVEHDIGSGDGLGGTRHPKLKFVAGEGQGAGAVSVSGVLGDGGEHIHTNAKHTLFGFGVVGAVDDGLDDSVQFCSQENGDDGGRGLTGTKTVIVSGGSYCAPEEILVFIHTGNESRQKYQEPSVLTGGFAGAEQILSGIGGQRPVVVFTGAVHPGERLFVEQTNQIVLGSALFHDFHNQLVVITGGIGIGIDGGHFVLAGSTLVVLGLAEDSQPPQLFIQIFHEGGNPGPDGSEVVVVQFLTLGRLSAEQSTAGQAQILPLCVQILGQQEILLLRTHRGDNALGFGVTEQP